MASSLKSQPKTQDPTIGGIVDEPTGEWVVQRFREMTFEDDPFLKDKTYLIVDRGSVFTDKLERLLKGEGIKLLRLPPSSPNLNAFGLVPEVARSIDDPCYDFHQGSPLSMSTLLWFWVRTLVLGQNQVRTSFETLRRRSAQIWLCMKTCLLNLIALLRLSPQYLSLIVNPALVLDPNQVRTSFETLRHRCTRYQKTVVQTQDN